MPIVLSRSQIDLEIVVLSHHRKSGVESPTQEVGVEDRDVERESLTDDVRVVATLYWTRFRIWLGSGATVMTGRVGFVTKTSWT